MNRLWLRQIRGVLRLELRKNLFSIRAVPIYLLASLPLIAVLIFVAVSTAVGLPSELQGPGAAMNFFAGLYQFIIRVVVYFGSVWIFMNLFRGEVLDRSLHYYFLTPVRREVLVAGKYISALVATSILFAATTLACFVVIYSYLGGGAGALSLGGAQAGHLPVYIGVTLLGCLGYGAVFLFVGLLFRNPLVPAIAFFAWEGLNPLWPSLLKKISVIFYLQSLFPVPLTEGPFAVIAEPTPAWIGVIGLILFTTAVLVISGLRIRRMEIHYAAD